MSKPKAKLPKEVRAFAKSMGISFDGLEPEAEDIWKMLNEMSESNPVQYEEFVRSSIDESKREAERKTEQNKRTFRPVIGFTVRTSTLHGDGVKVREIKTTSITGKALYINLCSSVVIEAPTDKSGKTVDITRETADGLAIPLLIGPKRDVDSSIAIDVIFNPIVVDLAASSKFFKAQIVDLALDWITKETDLQFDRKWEYFDRNYFGGRGEDKLTPVLFIVHLDEAIGNDKSGANNSGQSKDTDTEKIIANPSALLSQLKTHDSEQQVDSGVQLNVPDKLGVKISGTKGAVAEKGKVLIQEINDSGNNNNSNEKIVLETLKAVEPAAVEVPMSLQSVTSAIKQAPAPPQQPDQIQLKPPTRNEVLDMERLMRQFDGEYSSSLLDYDVDMTEQSLSYLSDLAKVITPGLNSSANSAASMNQTLSEQLRLSSTSPVKTSITELTPTADKKKNVVTTHGVSLARGLQGMPALSNAAESVKGAASTVTTAAEFEVFRRGKKATDLTLKPKLSRDGGLTVTLHVTGLAESLDPSTIDLQLGDNNATGAQISRSTVSIGLQDRFVGDNESSAGSSDSRTTCGVAYSGSALSFQPTSASAVFKKKKRSLVVTVQCQQHV